MTNAYMNTEIAADLSWNLAQSPFSSVIQTNYIPSTEDLVCLEALLTESQLQLAQLESEVAHVQNLLDTLLLRRDNVKAYVEAHRALMSPMRRLPKETLSEIFIRCLPEDRYAVRSVAEAPLLLTAVSREWRQAAIGTPALWSSLHLYLPSELSSQTVHERIIGSTLWLDRTGSLPVSISLYCEKQISPNDNSLFPNLLGGFVELLMKFNNRIKELTLTGSNFDHIASHLDSLLSLHNFPILDIFCIRNMGPRSTRYGDSELPFASLVQRMPALRKLWIDGFPHHIGRYTQLQLDWNNLTELMLSGRTMFRPSAGEMLNILTRTPYLQSLTFRITIKSDWEPIDANLVVTLPAMQYMHIVFVGEGNALPEQSFFQNLFSSIICPSLKVLNASHNWASSMKTHIPFSSLVSLQEIEKLSLDMPMAPDSLLECLSLVPNLRTLEIRSTPTRVDGHEWSRPILFSHTVNDSVLIRLNRSSSRTEGSIQLLCPYLQRIRIIFKGNHNISNSGPLPVDLEITNDVLLTFLECRVQKKILQSCDIFFAEPPVEPTEEDLRRIQGLLDSGLKLRIRYAKQQVQHDSPIAGVLISRSGYAPALQGVGTVGLEMEGRFGTGIIV